MERDLYLTGLSITFHQFVAVLFALFFSSLLAEKRKLLQQGRYLINLPALSERLDEMIERRLILGIALQSFAALNSSHRVLPSLQV